MAKAKTQGQAALVKWAAERSQAEIAAVLGIGQQTVSGYLSGRFRPGPLMRLKLREVAGIDDQLWLTEKERGRLGGRAA